MYVLHQGYQRKIEHLAKEAGLWQIFEELNVNFPYPEVVKFYELAYARGVYEDEGEDNGQSI